MMISRVRWTPLTNGLMYRCRAVPILILLASLIGCSQRLESTVSGTVTLDGERIGPGVVNFSLVSGDANPAIGAIQPDGSYFLKTSRTEGLLAGKYKVAVSVFVQPANLRPGERSMAEPKLRTPEKYDSCDTSGLEFDVAPGSNTIDIKLTSDAGSRPSA